MATARKERPPEMLDAGSGAVMPPTEQPDLEKKPRRKRTRRTEIPVAPLAEMVDHAKTEAKKRRIAEMAERVDKALEAEQEEEWFKQGEKASSSTALSERQQEEDARRADAIRRSLEGEGAERKTETIIETDQELEAVAREAETMLSNGELNPEVFNAKDYRYQLLEKARLDRELESAGWWQARKLRAELRETLKNLDDYEQQIMRVHAERSDERERAGMPERASWRPPTGLPQGSGTTLHKEGGGTTVHKAGFFARFFRKK